MAQEVTTLKQIEQGRATHAYDAVNGINKIEGLSEKEAKRLKESYKSATKKLPVLIKTNGLGQTLAFIKSKRAKRDKPKNGYDKLYKQIGDWLQDQSPNLLVPKGELVKKVIELPSPEYRQVTVETLALLNWMRRFVEGLMKDVEDKEETEESN